MKIKHIHFKHYGPYKDWSFTPKEEGLHLIYGPNESGKTSFLEGIRSLIFGFRPKERKESSASMRIERAKGEYFIGREGKELNFYKLGEGAYKEEPANLWWHGLDRRTYERIFGLTLEDMQGQGILQDEEVRTRFFGAQGSEHLSDTVKEIKKATSELLVSSANGKRKINLLLEKLARKEEEVQELARHEEEYITLREAIAQTHRTEGEWQQSLRQWKDYYGSVELVLRAWDTFKRMEDAKARMDKLVAGTLPDQEAFRELDQHISQCRENMRIWRGKEEALVPDNFTPDAPVGTYSHDIEHLNEQLGRWEKLIKDCEQGETYITSLKERLAMARHMHTTWREKEELPREIDWYEGERLARQLRSSQEAYEQWKRRAPEGASEDVTSQSMTLTESDILKQSSDIEVLRHLFGEKQRLESTMAVQEGTPSSYRFLPIMSAIFFAIVVLLLLVGKGQQDMLWTSLCIIFTLLGAITFGVYQYKQSSKRQGLGQFRDELHQIVSKMELLCVEQQWSLPMDQEQLEALRVDVEDKKKAFYSQDRELVKQYTLSRQLAHWEEEGQRLQGQMYHDQAQWEAWRPAASNAVCGPEHFFAMKQEYDAYREQYQQWEGYEKILQAHRDELATIEGTAKELWEHLGLIETPTPTRLRILYKMLQQYRQSQVRYEQKESQRKTYREEYDKWHCKEKELLIAQEEILQKGGFQSAPEFRQKMLSMEQYRQWETIYKQSKVQLELLAPQADLHDLLLRRLREGDKQKWEDEATRATEEINRYEQKLATLHEERGQLTETMRHLGCDKAQGKAILQKSQLETELRQCLKEWATQVYVSHFINEAQADYEKEKQPHTIDLASHYLQALTGGKYTLSVEGEKGSVVAHDDKGVPYTVEQWSSGLADQIYLALRLSLAKRFGQQVEPLPIILDDILLRFDEGRQRNALALLARLSKEEQIFVFTCQEQTKRIAQGLNEEDIHLYEFTPQGLQVI